MTHQRPPVTITKVKPNSALLDKVIALGDANKLTLGFLPWAGFHDAADRGCIIAAVTADAQLAAYCLFDLPGNFIRVVHLCVLESFRGSHLARNLIDAVSEAHRDRLGMRLKCRTDWPADTMWASLGFVPGIAVPGRSKEGHLLRVWWRSHGHPDLFSELIDEHPGVKVAVDSNVYSDLNSSTLRNGAHHSRALAPLIAGQEIRLVIPHSVVTELYQTQDADLKRQYLSALDHYELLSAAERMPQLRDELLGRIPAANLEADPSLKSDAAFIAEAIIHDVTVVVTRDENAVRQFAKFADEEYGVTVVNPAEIRSLLDLSESPTSYLPAQLQETAYETRRAQPQGWRWDRMHEFLDKPGGETRAHFTERLRAHSSVNKQVTERWLIDDPAGRPRAAWVTTIEDSTLNVHFLRVTDEALAVTIARQLTFHLRRLAVEANCTRVTVTDDHTSRPILANLQADGFIQGKQGWSTQVLALCQSWEKINASLDNPLDTSDGPPPLAEIAEKERVSWPARLVGAGISNYVVPIKGALAADLLGYPRALSARPELLGLSREHVYYRGAQGRFTSPARILWYASGHPQDVFGCSRLIETVVGSPTSLHRRFARLGVYKTDDVHNAASGKNGKVQVLRFTDTEIFPFPVTLDRLRTLAAQAKRPDPVLRSATAIDEEFFKLIYREGTRR